VPSRKLFHILSLLLFLILLVRSGGVADTIVLKNGNRIQGEIVEENPEGVTVRFFGGTIHLKRRDISEVERESRIQYLLERGEVYLRRQDPENAITAFEKALQEKPESQAASRGLVRAQERKAELLAEQGLYRASISAYEKLLELAPDHGGVAEARARLKATLREGAALEAAARKALGQGAVAGALSRYRDLYRRFPERRLAIGPYMARALILQGNNLLASNRLEEAESHYLEAVSLEPDLLPAMISQFVNARVKRLVALASENEFKKLLILAGEGLQVAPGNEVLMFLAAVGQEGLGRKEEAAEAYLKISGLRRPGNLVKSLEELRRAAEAKVTSRSGVAGQVVDSRRDEVLPGNWREIETENFVVHHRNDIIGMEVSEAAEASYRRMHRELSLKQNWRRKCTVTIFPSREEFQNITKQESWSGGGHRILRRLGVLTDHRIYSFQTQPRLSSAVIPHEVGHAMLAFAVGYRHEVPLWLNEGFATQWEPPFIHRYYRRVTGHAARTGTLDRLSTLLSLEAYPQEEEKVRLFYAECFTLVELLLDVEEMPELIEFARELAASPGLVDILLKRFYQISGRKALENRWIARLR